MAWIARLYRCDTPAKLHEELARAPEIVAGAGMVRCGLLGRQLVLSNDNPSCRPADASSSKLEACGYHHSVRLAPPQVDSSAGALRTPLPCCTTMSPRGALHHKILTEMPLGSLTWTAFPHSTVPRSPGLPRDLRGSPTPGRKGPRARPEARQRSYIQRVGQVGENSSSGSQKSTWRAA